MRRLVFLLFAFTIITACTNNKKANTKEETGGQKDDKAGKEDSDNNVRTGNRDRDNTTQSTWPEREQNKFLEDCRRESEEEVDKVKLKDFCSCMLVQAQKYYPGYSQMEEKSDEDHDREIFAKCLEHYNGDEK